MLKFGLQFVRDKTHKQNFHRDSRRCIHSHNANGLAEALLKPQQHSSVIFSFLVSTQTERSYRIRAVIFASFVKGRYASLYKVTFSNERVSRSLSAERDERGRLVAEEVVPQIVCCLKIRWMPITFCRKPFFLWSTCLTSSPGYRTS